jgi:hypothetical protein
MLSTNHVTKKPVRQAMKITRSALNHALDVAEPRIEQAAIDLEDLSRDAIKTLRKRSRAQIEDLRDGYDRIEKRIRRRIPRHRVARVAVVALVAAGVAALIAALFRSA